jgi:hypothetical protein
MLENLTYEVFLKKKKRAKFTLEQAMKAQRGSREV